MMQAGDRAAGHARWPAGDTARAVWWLIGIVMMWAMCFKAGLSFLGEAQIQRAERDTKIVVHEVAPAAISGGSNADPRDNRGGRA